MLGCQCRHEFSDSNSWTTSTDVPPKELRWPLCTYWRLGWCKMPRVPVLTQRCGCCQVVVNWYWMLCHTQFIHNLVWNEQWSATVSAGCLCPLPTSSVQPLGWDWEPPYVSIPKCQWLHRWRLGIDKWLHPTHYNRWLLLHAGIKVKPHESQGPLVGDVIPNLHGTRLWVILFRPKCPGWVD